MVEALEGRRRALQHLRGEDVRRLFVEELAQAARQVLVRGDVVDAPDHGVSREVARIVRREVERHVGRERPVEKSRGKAVMLREREPVPNGIARYGARAGELPEVAQEVALRGR